MKSIHVLVIFHAAWQLCAGAKPKFDTTTVNVTTIKGQTAVLPCTVIDKENHQVIWMNTKNILISTGDRRVIDDTRMSIERPYIRDWDLHIRNVHTGDGGQYTCQINTDPIQIKRIFLRVHVPAEIDNKTSSNDVVTREGTTIHLMCNATGIPQPTITWYRNILQAHQAKEHLNMEGEVLIIRNISRFCGGLYECEANNSIAQPVRRLINVDVEFPPEVSFRTPHRISQKRGKTSLLECFVTSFPHAVSQWTKNGKPLAKKTTWKYKTEIYKEDHFTLALYLSIRDLDADDYGTYTCEASNRLGSDSNSMVLYEYVELTPPPVITTMATQRTYPLLPTIPRDESYLPNNAISVGSGDRPAYISGHVGVGESLYGGASTLSQQTTVLVYFQTTLLFHLALTWLTLRIIYSS